MFETLAVYATLGKLTDRGYLFIMGRLVDYFPAVKQVLLLKDMPLVWGLPVILIYGVGGVLISLLFRSMKKHPLGVFFSSLVYMTLFELFSSYLTMWLLHKTFWDYSHDFMNFQGQICLCSTLE